MSARLSDDRAGQLLPPAKPRLPATADIVARLRWARLTPRLLPRPRPEFPLPRPLPRPPLALELLEGPLFRAATSAADTGRDVELDLAVRSMTSNNSVRCRRSGKRSMRSLNKRTLLEPFPKSSKKPNTCTNRVSSDNECLSKVACVCLKSWCANTHVFIRGDFPSAVVVRLGPERRELHLVVAESCLQTLLDIHVLRPHIGGPHLPDGTPASFWRRPVIRLVC